MSLSIIGIDPGGTTGVALLQMRPGADGTARICATKVFQVGTRRAGKGEKSEDIIERLEEEFALLFAAHQRTPSRQLLFAVEKFVVGPRAGRSATPQASEVARKVIGQLWTLAHDVNAGIVERTASQVKLWATDARLRRAAGAVASVGPDDSGQGTRPWGSVFDATKGLPHARDAARHALFAGRHDARWPDPLSRAYWEPLDALTSDNAAPGE
jgi:hypothetical protein